MATPLALGGTGPRLPDWKAAFPTARWGDGDTSGLWDLEGGRCTAAPEGAPSRARRGVSDTAPSRPSGPEIHGDLPGPARRRGGCGALGVSQEPGGKPGRHGERTPEGPAAQPE